MCLSFLEKRNMNKKITDAIDLLLTAVGEEITEETSKQDHLHTLKSGLTGLVWSAIRAARTEPKINRSLSKFPRVFRPFLSHGVRLEAPPNRQMRYDPETRLLKMWPTPEYLCTDGEPILPLAAWPAEARLLRAAADEDECYELNAEMLHLSASPTTHQKKTCSRFYFFLAQGDGVLSFEPLSLTGEEPKEGQPYVDVDVICRVLRRMDKNRVWTLTFRYAEGKPRYSITDGRWMVSGFASIGGIPTGKPRRAKT